MSGTIHLRVEAFWRSPWDFSAFVCLREKGVPFHTSIAMTRPGVGLVDAMQERTLTGTAPVLQHDELWLAESLAIIEYLEETFPAPEWPRLLPEDTHDRARARQLLSWLFGTVGVVDFDFAFALMRLVGTGTSAPPQVAAYVASIWARPSVREFIEHPRPPNAPHAG
jgi:glutathione S-transferase